MKVLLCSHFGLLVLSAGYIFHDDSWVGMFYLIQAFSLWEAGPVYLVHMYVYIYIYIHIYSVHTYHHPNNVTPTMAKLALIVTEC